MDSEDKVSFIGKILGKFFNWLKWLIYSFRVFLHSKFTKIFNKKPTNDKKVLAGRKLRERVFLITLFAWPAVCFCINFFWANGNMFILCFKAYDREAQSFYFLTEDVFQNFAAVINDLRFLPDLSLMIKNSFINLGFGMLVTSNVALMVSFFLYKKAMGHKFYVVIMFLPQIISSIVFTITFKYLVEYAPRDLFGMTDLPSLINNPQTSFWTLQIFSFWIGFANGMILYTGLMARIPHDIVEAAEIDGCNMWKEFWRITLPLVWPQYSIGVFLSVPLIFTGSPNTFAFFGSDAPPETYTFGYYYFKIIVNNGMEAFEKYGYASAAGLIFTAVAVPLTYLAKYLCERGPQSEI